MCFSFIPLSLCVSSALLLSRQLCCLCFYCISCTSAGRFTSGFRSVVSVLSVCGFQLLCDAAAVRGKSSLSVTRSRVRVACRCVRYSQAISQQTPSWQMVDKTQQQGLSSCGSPPARHQVHTAIHLPATIHKFWTLDIETQLRLLFAPILPSLSSRELISPATVIVARPRADALSLDGFLPPAQ